MPARGNLSTPNSVSAGDWGRIRTADAHPYAQRRRDSVVRLLAHLPEQQRKVVVLRHYADLSEAQVAELLGISVGAVKSAASRGLAALRSHAAPCEGGSR